MTPTPTRKLSLHERFSVSRANLGFAHVVSVLVAYPNRAALPTDAFLGTRIAELQQHFPLLYASVKGRKTREPYFEQRASPWDAAHVLFKSTYTPSPTVDSRAAVLKTENDRASAKDFDKEPLWSVGVYTAATAADSPAYLVLGCNHVLNDGKGTFLLLDALVKDDISSLPTEKTEHIARLEDTLDMKPGLVFLSGTVWAELVVPRLPTVLQSYLGASPSWPAQTFGKPAFECPGELAIIDLPAELIKTLRDAGKAHGVPTLHPILKFSFATALWAVKRDTLDPFSMTLQTPAAVRDSKLGHAYCTANYVSSISIPFSPGPSASFWTQTAKAASYMSSNAGKARALQSMGTLAYIPDPAPDQAKSESGRPTGWEDFLYDKGYSDNRFPASLGVSNIGKVHLPPNAVDLVWSQSAWPGAPPFEVNIVGHSAGLKIVPVWRDGAAVTRQDLDQIVVVWRRILDRLADPTYKGTTLEELVQ